MFPEVAEHGIPFVGAIMTVDLRHNIVAGFETGFEDIVARPDLDTLVRLPWDPNVAWCLADLESLPAGEPYEVSPRTALRRVVESYTRQGLTPVCGPELEFYLCEPDASAPSGYRPYDRHDSPVYTVGFVADRLGVLDRMLESCVALGLGALAASHEYGRGQYEINIGHTSALPSADRAFLFKTLVKELAARDGLLATFMGKPWNDDEGSGFHLHISLATRDSANAFDDPRGPDGVSPLVRRFTAGVIAHAPALMAFLNPTVNAYRRIAAQGLVPTRANWGHDNRFTLVRVPKERGNATRLEVRVGDGTANPYLAYAAVLLAGMDGITRELEPPAPLAGNIYLLPEEELGDLLPTNLETALEALANDRVLAEGMGEALVSTFTMMKNAELDRYHKWTSDWEFTEYSHHL
jgi:glutamine synthetase